MPCSAANEGVCPRPDHLSIPSRHARDTPLAAHPFRALFNAYWAAWTALFLAPLAILAAAGSPVRPIRAATRPWARGILFGLRTICGLSYVEEGRERIPAEPCLIVANHQSAWETLAFLILVPDVAIVAKRELVAIPVVGWFLRRSPMIIIDRANGTQALRTMIDESRAAIAEGRSVLIFPEGTRGPSGSRCSSNAASSFCTGELGLAGPAGGGEFRPGTGQAGPPPAPAPSR